jgi:hypothetical protein
MTQAIPTKNVTPIGAAKVTAPITQRSSRMTLANVRKGRLHAPVRVLIFGVEGVGKSTFAMRAPAPIFLGKENGTEELDVERLPEPRDWTEVMEGIDSLQREETPYKTLVIDPVNWLEPLCWAHVCKAAGWASLDEPGYGKGFDAALDEWRRFVAALERLWETRKMNILLVAHAQVKGFNDPETADTFDRYQIAMNQKAAGLLKQWCSAVLFARHELFTHKHEKTKRVRGVSNGARRLFTQWSAAYDAKNRYSLPASLPLSWDEFWAAVEAGRSTDLGDMKARADEVRARIEEMLAEIGDAAYAAKAREVMAGAADDATKLAEVENRIAAKMQTIKKGDE